jgi:lipopolysaccharide exporter
MSTSRKITRGLSWNTLTVVLQVVIQLIYTAILARLIAPGDFAVMGVVLGLMGFAEIFSQVGIGPALIQRREVHPQHLSGAFYTALILGILFTGVFFAIAPWLEDAYQSPGLSPIIRMVSISFIISALGVVPRSMMIKALSFRRFFTAGMISIVGGNLVVGLALAWAGLGIWAYVWALFAQNVLMTAAYWILSPVSIPLSWKWSYTRELIRYGTGSTLFNALNYAATKVDVTLTPLLAMRVPGTDVTEQLRRSGWYERSAYVVSLPITIMGKLSDNVMFSGMSAMQDETDRLRRVVLIAQHALSLAIIPAVSVAACLSPEIIRIYLGDQYRDAGPILAVLLPGVIFRTLSRISDSLLRARDATFRGSFVKAVYLLLMSAGVVLSAAYGMVWVAASVSVTTAIHLIMAMMLNKRLIGVSMGAQVRAALPGLLTGAVITAVLLPLTLLLRLNGFPPLLILLAGVLVSAAAAAVLIIKIPKLLGSGEMNLVRFLPPRIQSHRLIRPFLSEK